MVFTRSDRAARLPTEPSTPDTVVSWLDNLVAAYDTDDLACSTHHYGDHPEQVADRWHHPATTTAGLVIVVHGGGFNRALDRHIMRPICGDLARRGYVTWNLEYRRTDCDGGPAPSTEDVVTGWSHVIDAEDVGASPIVVAHSAGGYLALRASERLPSRSVLALGSVCDLRCNARAPGDDYARFVGGMPAQLPSAYDDAELLRSGAPAAPVRLLYGDREQPHRKEENLRYAAALETRGVGVDIEVLPRTGHFGFLHPESGSWRRVVELVDSAHR